MNDDDDVKGATELKYDRKKHTWRGERERIVGWFTVTVRCGGRKKDY